MSSHKTHPPLSLNPSLKLAPTRDHPHEHALKQELPKAKEVKVHPGRGASAGVVGAPGGAVGGSDSSGSGEEKGNNAGIYFVGTATMIL